MLVTDVKCICDKVLSARCEWMISHTQEPEQVILPEQLYLDLWDWMEAHTFIYGFSGGFKRNTFAGMRVFSYDGDDIVFS